MAGDITVTLDGDIAARAKITARTEPAGCNTAGTASFITTEGVHNYTATSADGWEWSGIVAASSECTKFELRSANGSHPDYNITFWNNQLAVGKITITVDGAYTQIISSTKEAIDCNSSGSANFSLLPGFHTYSAIATTGESWNGSFNLDKPCLLYELYK